MPVIYDQYGREVPRRSGGFIQTLPQTVKLQPSASTEAIGFPMPEVESEGESVKEEC